jgi:hypothetical protein
MSPFEKQCRLLLGTDKFPLSFIVPKPQKVLFSLIDVLDDISWAAVDS